MNHSNRIASEGADALTAVIAAVTGTPTESLDGLKVQIEALARSLAPQPEIKLLRTKEVLSRTGLSRATLNRKVSAGDFPRPVSLGEASIAWRSTDVDDWIASLPIRGSV